MNWTTELAKAREIAEDCKRRVGMEDVTISFSFNGRFTARMGDAQVLMDADLDLPFPRRGRVRLSKPLWPEATEGERENTIRHEVAHILANIKYCKNVGHSALWRAMFLAVGGNGKRCHQVAAEKIQERRRKKRQRGSKRRGLLLTCTCGTAIRIGPGQAARLRNGTATYRHRCGHLLRPLDLLKAEPLG